jgi:hypothetical protein
MGDRESALALLTVGLGLVVVGLLLGDSAAWYLQYAVLGVGLLLNVLAFYRTTTAASSSQEREE